MMLEIVMGNTNVAQVTGVKSSLSPDMDDGAVLVFSILDKTGTPVTGQTWPSPMYNSPGGTYIGSIESDVDILESRYYTVEVRGQGSAGEVMTITDQAKAVRRPNDC